MTGIMTAIAGTVATNVLYADGLYNTTDGVDLSPITGSAVNITLTRTWIGYYKPASTATVKLGIQTLRSAGNNGGSASTSGRLWFGDNAESGFTDGNANVTAINQYSTSNISMTGGVYYPIRIRWDGAYEEGFFGSNSSGSITLFVNDNSTVTGLVFYNTLTNGF